MNENRYQWTLIGLYLFIRIMLEILSLYLSQEAAIWSTRHGLAVHDIKTLFCYMGHPKLQNHEVFFIIANVLNDKKINMPALKKGSLIIRLCFMCGEKRSYLINIRIVPMTLLILFSKLWHDITASAVAIDPAH